MAHNAVKGTRLIAEMLSGNLPMKVYPIALVLFLLFTGCAHYSPGRFDFDGPYPLVRYDDGTPYELPSGNGHH